MDGEEAQGPLHVANLSAGPDGRVTVNTHERHGLQDGECVTFTEGPPSLQGCAPAAVEPSPATHASFGRTAASP